MMLKALDFHSGAGGATRGLQDAGFAVTGVDIVSQPRYVGDRFICADVLSFTAEYIVSFDCVEQPGPANSIRQ
jgi:DNA (cytosine-5)-methyltransferase 1